MGNDKYTDGDTDIDTDSDTDTDSDSDTDSSSDSDFDNVTACESLFETLNELECVEDGFDRGVDCSVYADTDCNLSNYFSCLEDNSICDYSFLDISGWGDCVDLADC